MSQSKCDKEGSVSEAGSPLSGSGESCISVFSGLNVQNERKEKEWFPKIGGKKESQETGSSVNKSHSDAVLEKPDTEVETLSFTHHPSPLSAGRGHFPVVEES